MLKLPKRAKLVKKKPQKLKKTSIVKEKKEPLSVKKNKTTKTQIEETFRNVYFHKSKKFRPAKNDHDEFQFDFSLFDSNNPEYPRALDDINFKLLQTNSFWKNVEQSTYKE